MLIFNKKSIIFCIDCWRCWKNYTILLKYLNILSFVAPICHIAIFQNLQYVEHFTNLKIVFIRVQCTCHAMFCKFANELKCEQCFRSNWQRISIPNITNNMILIVAICYVLTIHIFFLAMHACCGPLCVLGLCLLGPWCQLPLDSGYSLVSSQVRLFLSLSLSLFPSLSST